MKICELFASYARFHSLKSKRSTFKLLDKIMSHLFYQINRHFSGVFLVAIYILNIGSIKKVLFLLIMSFYGLNYIVPKTLLKFFYQKSLNYDRKFLIRSSNTFTIKLSRKSTSKSTEKEGRFT